MSSSSSGRARGLLKRVAHGAKKVFKSTDQVPISHTPSPPPHTLPGDPPPQLAPSHEPDSDILPHSSTRSQRTATIPQPMSSLSQPTPAELPSAGGSTQLTNAESSLTLVARKAGADAWSGLKVALQLLKESSDVFPPVKSAVGEFLGVVDIFEVSDLSLHVLGCHLF